jgi:peptidyl-prolyl cis-trans isomerase C
MAADFLKNTQQMAAELARDPGVVVAEVGGQPITRGDVADAFAQLPVSDGNRPFEVVYHDVVQRLLAQKAMAMRARELHIDQEPIEVERMVAAVDRVLADEFLRRAIAPALTDQVLHDAYEHDIASQPGPEEVQARVIVTFDQASAQDAERQLLAGADFADLARRVSRDASAAAGGEIGFVRLEQVSPQVGAVMFALAPGQVTAFPVQAGGAWFIVKVESRRQLPVPTFDSVRGQLYLKLLRVAVPTTMQKAMQGLPVKDYGMAGRSTGEKPATAAGGR